MDYSFFQMRKSDVARLISDTLLPRTRVVVRPKLRRLGSTPRGRRSKVAPLTGRSVHRRAIATCRNRALTSEPRAVAAVFTSPQHRLRWGLNRRPRRGVGVVGVVGTLHGPLANLACWRAGTGVRVILVVEIHAFPFWVGVFGIAACGGAEGVQFRREIRL